MNEFITDLKKPVKIAEELVAASASAADTAVQKVTEEVCSALDRGRGISSFAWKRMGNEADAANAAFHRNPYPAILAGIGAGALLGLLVVRMVTNKSA